MRKLGRWVWAGCLSLLTGCLTVQPVPRPSPTSVLPSVTPASASLSPLNSSNPSLLPVPSPSVAPTPSPSPSEPIIYPLDPITGEPNFTAAFKSLPVEVVAGSGQKGFQDGPALQASFNRPWKPCFNFRDNSLYIPDTNMLRKLTADGQVVSVAGGQEAGYKDGPASEARFNFLVSCAVDSQGGVLLVDKGNWRIRKLSADGQTVSTFLGTGAKARLDGDVAQASLAYPWDIALGPGDEVYLSDSYWLRVLREGKLITLNPAQSSDVGKYDAQDGNLIGSDPLKRGTLGAILWFTADKDGNLYLADEQVQSYRRVDRQGNLTTLSLRWDAANKKYGYEYWRHYFSSQPIAVTYDSARNKLFLVADNHVFESDLQGEFNVIAGRFSAPQVRVFTLLQDGGIVVGKDHHLYVVDGGSYQIKRILLPPP